ncbi:MAG: hypothetical protein ACK5MY_05675 [Jhaorihella sp.]
MRKLTHVLSAAVVAAGIGTAGSAAPVTLVEGDKDCFGLGGTCAVGDRWRDDLGGVFFTDYSTASDPVGTDNWDTSAALGGPSISFDLSGVGTIVSASLSIFYAGLELATGGDVKVNGTSVGTLQTFGPDAFQLVDLGVFGGIEALLAGSSIVDITASSGGDGFIVDYMQLDLEVAAAIPLPASLPLIGGALFGLVALGRRRKPKTA